MKTNLVSVAQAQAGAAKIYLADGKAWAWAQDIFSADEIAFLAKVIEKGSSVIQLVKDGIVNVIAVLPKSDKGESIHLEAVRRLGVNALGILRQYYVETVTVINQAAVNEVYEFVEGLVLANYQFRAYLTEERRPSTPLKTVEVLAADLDKATFTKLQAVLTAVCHSRDLVNEPLSTLNALTLAQDFEKNLGAAGVNVKVLHKAEIEALNMQGLLTVNKGSTTPPTFTIMEWKPANAKNTQPIVLVGKGLVYDTGGYSLKPTGASMDHMKCDMGGAAVVSGVMEAAAKVNLPLHIIALVPSTDNMCDANAYVPGDVINMADGTTVEVLNTDAEGRLILADALHYAKQYNPLFVFDFATLTGAAARAIGQTGCAIMGNVGEEIKKAVIESGYRTYERAMEFPLWPEYTEMIKSEIADIKNVGGPEGGAQTAATFLQNFTNYPWLHFDIAGVAFNFSNIHYLVKGGTGWGVRVVFDFLENYAKEA